MILSLVLWRQLNKIRCAARGPGGVRPGHGTCHRLDEVRSCLISAIGEFADETGMVGGGECPDGSLDYSKRDGQGLAVSAGGAEVATFTQTGGAEGEAPVDAEADLFDRRTMVACAACSGSLPTASVSIGNSSHRSGTPPSAADMRATASQRSCGD